jgi:glycosyltransferase involved in cell wall biosynthesis
LGLNLLTSVPYSVQWNDCPRLREAVQRYNRANEVDIWQVEWAPYATTFLGASGMNWAMMAHDIQSFTWERYYRNETNLLKRWYIKKQWQRYRRYESRVFSEAPLTITVSDEDQQRAREHFSARRTTVVDNGVDVAHYQELAPRQPTRNASEILFLGNLEWRPNLDAVRLLLDEVFPAVLAAEPSARLCIVGRRPPSWLQRRGSETNRIEVHADVDDVRPFLYRCGAMAVPLRIGGGSRLKILEALACGMPVVASSIGAEGLRLQPGQHFALANETSEMARVLVEWMRNPAAALAMAEAGRSIVEAQYDWSVLAEKMESAWDELVGCSYQTSHPQIA